MLQPSRPQPPCRHYAASARPGSCARSFHRGRSLEFRGWNNLFRQRFEARIAVHRKERRIDPNHAERIAVAIVIAFLQPTDCFTLIADAESGQSQSVGGGITLRA